MSKKNNKATFYIVTPSFNQAHFIEQTISSVISQKGEFSIRYIVMDGGSTDNTKQVLKKFGNKVSWISKKDNGQADALNKGIKILLSEITTESKNSYFAFINSDDFYFPGAFSAVDVAFRSNPDINWIVGDAVIVNEKNNEIQPYIRLYKKFLRFFLSYPMLLILNPFPQPSTFVRLNVVRDIGGFDGSLNYTMDYDFWLKVYKKYGRPHLLAKPLSNFRIHSTSKGGSQYTEQFNEELKVAGIYSQEKLILFLHRLHNMFVVNIYNVIKK